MVFSIDPYTYQLTVSGNADRDILSQIEKLLNEGDNAKNIWTHAWICMHDADNEIVNSQANMTKANQYSLWHEVYETTGYDARNATYKNGTFIAEDGTDLLVLFKEKAKNGAGYELYSNRWLEYAKNGWKKENDVVADRLFSDRPYKLLSNCLMRHLHSCCPCLLSDRVLLYTAGRSSPSSS